MKNGWVPRTKLGNKNVPEGAEIIGSIVEMSGEVIYTYYKLHGQYYRVLDWVDRKPIKISLSRLTEELSRVTDVEQLSLF